MSLISCIRTGGRAFMVGGPVGVYYTLKLAWLRWRTATVTVYIDREKDLHRAHMAALNHELNGLVAQQQSTNIAAAQFWRWCEKQEAQS